MISTEGVTFQYSDYDPIVFPDIHVDRGEHTLLIGQSGCGKTTLLHILAGLRKPQKGEVRILNQEITKMPSSKLDQYRGRHIGMIFQVPHFIKSISVLDNLTMAQSLAGIDLDRSHCISLLDNLGLADKVRKKTWELSAGEQQRVAIARSLVNRPEIIFADEPTSALDDKNTEHVINLLRRQADEHGATLLVVTHDQRLKDNFDNKIDL
jgi:ABC-type antimicrobial peptide transport system, ATPase component